MAAPIWATVDSRVSCAAMLWTACSCRLHADAGAGAPDSTTWPDELGRDLAGIQPSERTVVRAERLVAAATQGEDAHATIGHDHEELLELGPPSARGVGDAGD